MWESHINNLRVTIIKNSLNFNSICVINDGNPTHHSVHNTFTHSDITGCSPFILPFISCKNLIGLQDKRPLSYYNI